MFKAITRRIYIFHLSIILTQDRFSFLLKFSLIPVKVCKLYFSRKKEQHQKDKINGKLECSKEKVSSAIMNKSHLRLVIATYTCHLPFTLQILGSFLLYTHH